jgi:hypothetical protein
MLDPDFTASNGRMTDELERIWKEAIICLRYYPGICLERLKKP